MMEFWDKRWKEFEPFPIDPTTFREKAGLTMFLDRIGNVDGKNVLDMGCGNGQLSVYLAKLGANVTAIDSSQVAVENTKKIAKVNQVELSLEPYRLNALELSNFAKQFDLVVGMAILHHIEPFEVFSEILYNILTKGGRGIFLENNSRNPVLMFCRSSLVGRFGIPKYGDDEEHPFEPSEIEILRQRFHRVHVYYPDFRFFIMMGIYLFRRNRLLCKLLKRMDECVYSYLPIFHKYSYNQIIEVEKI